MTEPSIPAVESPALPQPIPISVLTGFLGSGKTTLLSKLLRHPGMADTAVIINEFGEVGLDHHLVSQATDDIVLMDSGCLCCTVRGDLVNALRKLYLQRVRGEVPEFKRVVVETTGLADPAPIIHTLMEDPILETYYRLDGVVTTVDAVNAEWQLDCQFESVKQAAVADRIVLTKSDLAGAGTIAALERRLHGINPAAPTIAVVQGEVDPKLLFECGLYNPETKTLDVRNWLRAEAYGDHGHDHDSEHDHEHGHDHAHGDGHGTKLDVNRHDDRIRAHCHFVDEPLDWERFALWMGLLIRKHGDSLLRIKGIVNVAGEDNPVAIHGVQHLFHPPARLPTWPDAERRSRIVFITRDIDRDDLSGLLARYREIADKGELLA